MAIINPTPDASPDLVVSEDGSVVIPSERVAKLHIPPGSGVRVEIKILPSGRQSIHGALKDLPELSWETSNEPANWPKRI